MRIVLFGAYILADTSAVGRGPKLIGSLAKYRCFTDLRNPYKLLLSKHGALQVPAIDKYAGLW
jgi:hypothetical protein